MTVLGADRLDALSDLPDVSMYEMVRRAAVADPDGVALIFLGRRITYRRLLSDIRRCARSFKALGLSDGDVLAIALPNIPQAVTAIYAANSIGVVCEMLHPLASPAELRDQCALAGARVLMVLDTASPKLLPMMSELCAEHVITTTVGEGLGHIKRSLYSLSRRDRTPDHPRIIGWRSLLRSGESIEDPCSDLGGDHDAIMLLTGGTTGTPKGALHHSSAFNALAIQTRLYIGDEPERFLAMMPVFHGFGLGQSVHAALANGWAALLMPRFNVREYCDNVVRHRCTLLLGTPTMFEAVASAGLLSGRDLGHAKGIFSGGDLLTEERYRRIVEGLPACSPSLIRQGYGLAEGVATVCVTEGLVTGNRIGRPYAGTLLTLTVPGTAEECRDGEEGEICVWGPTTMVGYVGHREETGIFIRHPDGRLWLHTGDIGRVENGELVFVGRRSRMIISNGYNIYPSQIENVFDRHPKVAMSYALPVPDVRKGEVVRICIVLSRGVEASPELEAELRSHAEANIARYSLPAQYVFLPEFPLTRVGKVDGVALKEISDDLAGRRDD